MINLLIDPFLLRSTNRRPGSSNLFHNAKSIPKAEEMLQQQQQQQLLKLGTDSQPAKGNASVSRRNKEKKGRQEEGLKGTCDSHRCYNHLSSKKVYKERWGPMKQAKSYHKNQQQGARTVEPDKRQHQSRRRRQEGRVQNKRDVIGYASGNGSAYTMTTKFVLILHNPPTTAAGSPTMIMVPTPDDIIVLRVGAP